MMAAVALGESQIDATVTRAILLLLPTSTSLPMTDTEVSTSFRLLASLLLKPP